jgi:hypothetical protein
MALVGQRTEKSERCRLVVSTVRGIGILNPNFYPDVRLSRR